MRAWAEGDRADHLARGIDQDAAIARIAAARDELEETWSGLGAAFARLLQ